MDEEKILFAMSVCLIAVIGKIKTNQSTKNMPSVIQVSNDKHGKSLMLQRIVLLLTSKRNKKDH